ncbi:MAG: UDP-N-acetylmuramate--L-alanine ligase [Gallicola sp.]|nr:UDP-N-acetylmuramate--L-alanine ligase [Gallicola sp.]
MFEFNLKDNNTFHKIHFIGIGGVSMSGIAELLFSHGFEITGSDREDSDSVQHLVSIGAKVAVGQKASNIDNPDLVIYTDAILPENEELIAAKALDVPVVTRGVFLGALMRNYKYSIGVSGSHGKSTTTSMIAKILINSEVDPNILIGGKLDEIAGNVHCGKSDYLVTEACEFKGNILHYYPSMAIILNIDEDHLDYFKDINHIVSTFIGYMKNLDKNSKALLNGDDENCIPLVDHVKGETITFGIKNPKVDYHLTNITYTDKGFPCFDIISDRFVKNGDDKVQHFELGILGRYNICNASAAIIACYETGISLDYIREHIKAYRNLHRRMEIIGDYNGTTIMTDYGHHPIEIKATLSALKPQTKGKLFCAFQPHTYSRTKLLMDDFAEAFYDADEVIVTEIYAARENFDPTVHSLDLVERLKENNVKAKYFKTFAEAQEYMKSQVEKNDIVLTTGCGNPDKLAKMMAGLIE